MEKKAMKKSRFMEEQVTFALRQRVELLLKMSVGA